MFDIYNVIESEFTDLVSMARGQPDGPAIMAVTAACLDAATPERQRENIAAVRDALLHPSAWFVSQIALGDRGHSAARYILQVLVQEQHKHD